MGATLNRLGGTRRSLGDSSGPKHAAVHGLDMPNTRPQHAPNRRICASNPQCVRILYFPRNSAPLGLKRDLTVQMHTHVVVHPVFSTVVISLLNAGEVLRGVDRSPSALQILQTISAQAERYREDEPRIWKLKVSTRAPKSAHNMDTGSP